MADKKAPKKNITEKDGKKKTADKTPVQKKPTKSLSAKKLPALLKKAYTQKTIEKKLFDKIYIDDDKKFLASFFKDQKGIVRIPPETLISAADFKRLKLIAKEVKKQKGGINPVPFAAIVIACVAICLTVTIFKNVIVKRAITAGMQQVFGAKTDIQSVDVKIFQSSLTVTGLAQANKNEPMKNIFEVGSIKVDFNLTQLLRGKFDAEDISAMDILFGTDRKTSGELPLKTATAKEKKVSKQSGEKSAAKMEAVKESIKSIFADYNPKAIIAGLENNLKSPALAESIKTETEALTVKWKDRPEQIRSDVEKLKADVQTITGTDWSKISNAAELAAALKTTQSAIENAKRLKQTTQEAASDIKADSNTVKRLSSSLQDAIKNDKVLIQKEVDKITSFSLDKAKSLLSDSMTAIAYDIFGKYYTYVQKGIDAALRLKSRSKAGAAGKAKKKVKTEKRMPGTDIYYKKDSVPKFLIEKAAASGKNFKAQVKEISSDPDLRGAPAVFDGTLSLAKQTHKLSGVVDGRTQTKEPLIQADYSGSGYPVAVNTDVIAFSGTSRINIKTTADDDGSVFAEGVIDLANLSLGSQPFEPESAYNIYKKALASIKTLKINLKAEYSADGGVDINLATDADKKLLNAMQELFSSELSSIKSQVQKEMTNLLSQKTGGALSALDKYFEIESLMNNQENAMNAINQQLSKKQEEISAQIKKQAGDAAKEKAKEAAGNVLKKLF
ncbi:TIGR03545 family protein [Treponema parvum]|uniref:TIGR03545 family protein n=1 Tax=Treponema parvum TaxID=138851 RepID=A0A975F396_9SPIR|nr:TIGR03545 family protein [Treponema parvum]QTQ13597.1 TIGR03545 family protein [Treponema parvum]